MQDEIQDRLVEAVANTFASGEDARVVLRHMNIGEEVFAAAEKRAAAKPKPAPPEPPKPAPQVSETHGDLMMRRSLHGKPEGYQAQQILEWVLSTRNKAWRTLFAKDVSPAALDEVQRRLDAGAHLPPSLRGVYTAPGPPKPDNPNTPGFRSIYGTMD